MKCPLMRIPITEKGKANRAEIDECIKEECAWWDDGVEQCGLLTASLALRGMLALLGQLADKIPHEEQFGR